MNKRTVLIVDDVYFMRNLLKKTLIEAGYEVVGEAKNGKEALVMHADLKPEIITMDIGLPDISGIEVTKQIVAKDSEVIIIAVTSSNEESIRQQMTQAGALEYLRKPFQPAFLWNKIDKATIAKEKIKSEQNNFINLKPEQKSNVIVLENNLDDDLFQNEEIEILNKPDESRQITILVESENDVIEFPEQIEKEKIQFELTREYLEEEYKSLAVLESPSVKNADKKIILIDESHELLQNIIEPLISKPSKSLTASPRKFKSMIKTKSVPPVEEPKITKPELPIFEKSNTNNLKLEFRKKEDKAKEEIVIPPMDESVINIRPPRAKMLRDQESLNTKTSSNGFDMNVSEDNNYNNIATKNGLFKKVKNLFKKVKNKEEKNNV